MQNATGHIVFDQNRRRLKELRANRIRTLDTDFLYQEAITTIAERIAVTNRQFSVCVDLFDATSKAAKTFRDLDNCGDVFKFSSIGSENSQVKLDRELLPIRYNSVSLVTSIFGLHWSNKMAGMLSQIKNVLRNDGLFMGAFPGPSTLQELRQCMLEAEASIYDSVSLRVEPFGEVKQYGDLLQQAGFTLPVVDTDTLTARYDNLANLVGDLRAMGATLSTCAKPRYAGRSFFELTEKIYRQKFSDSDGRIRATFQIVYLSGWAPDSSQQKPLKPGSAKVSLAKVLRENPHRKTR